MALPQDKLVLKIDNSRPIAAADLGRVFASMALDYREITGRQLIVSQLDGGSVVAILQDAISYFNDAAEFADSINHLFELAKNIAEITVMALGGMAITKIFGNGGLNGSRSLESIAKIAIAAGATVELYSSKSSELFLKIIPSEARRIRKFAKQNKKLKKPLVQKGATKGLSIEMRGAIVDAAHRGDETSKKLVFALAEMLKRHSLGYLLLEMANELEHEGYFDAAKLLREAHGGPSSKGQVPVIEN